MNNPTIVSAALSDKELQDSINKMVANFDRGLQTMLEHSNEYVGKIQKSLQEIGNTNFGAKGSNDGGVAKRTKAQSAETEAVEKNIAARDKQIKKNQEVSMSYDQMAAATQKATSGSKMSVIETYDMQIEMFKNRLREVRQDIDIFNAAIGSGKKTQIEWGQQGLKQANAEAEKLMRIITTLENQRGNLANVLAPQGHTIQNYVNSLQKANPELAQLNEQFKRGKSLLQQQKTEFEQNAQAQRNSTNQQKQSLDEMNAYIRQNIQREQERRDAIRQTGLAARESADQLIRSAHEQASAQGKNPITGAKELTGAVEKMRRAYFDMSASEKSSPIGLALEADIKRANDAIAVIRKYNQSLLGSQQNDANKITNASTLNSLRESLKNLTEQYNRLTVAELNAGKGDALIQHFQDTTREAQILQRTLNRPVNLKAALSGDERTLDDIAYKMQRLRSYRQGIDLTKPNAANEIKQVDEALARLQKDADKWMSKSQDLIKNNTALGRSWNYMKNRLAFYVTVGAGTSFIKQLVEIRSQYEMNEKALGILLDSASRGTRIFNELSQMALVSPYTLIELSNAAKQLTAYDIAAKDVVDTTRRLADMASAVGVPVERLTYALGQIKAYGYLNSRDARMFANAGIPLVKQLADRYSELEGKMVSTADVYDRMKKKAIDYNDVMAVINKMTDEGGKFFDFQAKMAETLKVRLANLTLAWNNMLNDMGKDNQGVMTTGLKGLTVMFKHWRELYRVISTAITALGAYKVATIIAGMATKTSIGGSAVTSWFALARGVKSAKDAVALFSLTLKSIPFTAWVTAIATLASYFILFNNSSDDVKQKLEDIKSAFDGVRKEIETLFADAIKTDNIGTQLTKLRDMLELAETELGVTIPIRLEDVNESNIKQKLKEAKQFVDEYINFSQTFSEAAAGTKFNELMNDFGSKARSVYTNVSESINSVVVALQELSDKGQASKRDIEILNELTSGQKEDESRIEYLQRLVSLYEELGLIGKKKVEPMIEHNFFKAYFTSTWDNMEELEQQQEKALDRLGIKNKSVFENMLKDVQGYYSSSSIAAYQFEQQVMRVAEKIDINNIPVEQRTMKLTAAINEEASQNNWNQFEKELARQVANKKFGTNITISDDSKKSAETELQEWQKKQQRWMDDHGLKITLSFQTNDTEVSYAKRMLQEAKDAAEEYQTQLRKLERGTGSQDAVDKALKSRNEARQKYFAAGGDMSLLDKKENAAARKAAKQAETELQKALKDELSTIDKVRSIYKDLTKEGMSHADAVERATRGWGETVNAINKVLQKNGLQKLNLADFVGIDNPREILKTLQAQLDALVKRGASSSEIKVLQEKIQTVSVDADKYDLTKITKGLNSELDRLKEEYELAVELDADPELGGIFADMFDLNIDQLPHTISEYAQKVTTELNKALKKRGDNIQLPTIYLTKDDIDAFREMSDDKKLNTKSFEDIQKAYQDFVSLRKKAATDVAKIASEYIREYGDLSAQIQQIEIEKNDALMKLNEIYNTDALRQTRRYLDAKFAIEDGAKRKQAKATFDALKKEADYERFFTAIDTLTKKDALSIKNKIKKGIIDAFKNGGLTISQFRKEIKALEEQFDKLSQPTSNWISYLNGGFDKLIQRAKETGQEIETIGEKISATGKVDEEDKNYLQSLGNIFSNGKGGNTDFSSLMSQFGKDMKGLGSNISKAGQGMQGASSNFASTVSIIDMIIKNIHQTVQGINSVIQELDSVRNEENKISNAYWEGFSKSDSYASSGWENLKSGNISGAVADTANSIISIFNTFENAKTDRINSEIKESEREVKRLENSYKILEFAADKAYGTAIAGANQATKANKELQLAELKRQLALEQSRDSKNKDEDKIIEIRGQIIDLEHEIKDFTKNAVNDLLGISSHGDFFESMISEMIDAFKNGEDAMKVFEEKWSDMIDNMIMKTIVSQVLSQWVKTLEHGANEILEKYTKESSKKMSDLASHITNLRTMDAGDVARWIYENDKENFDKILESLGERNDVEQFFSRDMWFDQAWDSGLANKIKEAYFAMLNSNMSGLQSELDKASLDATGELIDYYGEAGKEFKENYLGQILDKIQENWNFGQDSEKQLSQLQQGISQISETTANSIEAYLNGVSQQVYYHSSLLEQIRDSVVGLDLDVSLGVQSQMLLQLQSSYQTQQAIQQILEGVLNPSGRAFSVELIS